MKILPLLLLLFTFVSVAYADTDSGLYAPQISRNQNLIRFVNNTKDDVKPALSGTTYPFLKAKQVSPYYVIDTQSTSISGEIYDLEVGQFYTYILGNAPKLIKDTKNTNRAKAMIAFYNMSSLKGLNLMANQTIPVLEAVPPLEMKDREINGSQISFSVQHEGKNLLTLDDVILERNNHYSIFFDGERLNFVQAVIEHKK